MSSNNVVKKGRVFSFSDRICPSQPTGGPGGVNYRLLFANRTYGYVENMINIFSDVIVEKDAMINISLLGIDNNENEKLTRYLIKIHDLYHFTNDDIYIFHDIYSVIFFTTLFKVDKTILVYHQQGSLYKEWSFFNGKENEKVKKNLDSLLIQAINSVKYLSFPSIGAMESVIDSDPTFGELIRNANVKVLYNGCDNPDTLEEPTEVVQKIVRLINLISEPVFITVATLNEAKGVERIPEFLFYIKEKYKSFRWIVIGNGVKALELKENINKYGINENVIWLRERVPHDDILTLFKHTDYYILAHRYSIFDFSTIEAMNYGNIPILTPVGGNKEVIIDNNGIFLNDFSSCNDYDEFVSSQNLLECKQKNIQIANDLFSEKAFLKGYADLIDELLKN